MGSIRDVLHRAWAALVLAAGLTPAARSAEPSPSLLPPEYKTGEWIVDTMQDAGLWFAHSGNLAFAPVAPELAEYPATRQWAGAIDDQTAWVMYYVPGELLGFEVDTHHYAASAPNFTFSAGPDFHDLRPVAVETELVSFEANWLRLFHSRAGALPPGTRFLRIEFPADAARTFTRLTEVWMRCRLDLPPVPAADGDAEPTSIPADSSSSDDGRAAVDSLPPYVVFGLRFHPPDLPPLPATSVTASWGASMPGVLIPVPLATDACEGVLADAWPPSGATPELQRSSATETGPQPAWSYHGPPGK